MPGDYPMTASFFAGWREQYDRMLRGHTRLVELAGGTTHLDSDERRDALIHFFQDAFHLRDWLSNDPAVEAHLGKAAWELVNTDDWLAIAADLANGSKHFKLGASHRPRTGDLSTAFTSQNARVLLGASEAGARVEMWWTATSNGVEYDVFDIAARVVTAWTLWLHEVGLLAATSNTHQEA